MNVLITVLFISLSFSIVLSQENHSCCVDQSGDQFIEMSNDAAASGNVSDSVSSEVTAGTCVVSGEAIGEGQGVSFRYMGNDFTFCCEGCLAKFKREPLDYIKDELICPVMGDPVSKDVFAEHEGTKYYLCCKSCLKSFKKDPEKYINK